MKNLVFMMLLSILASGCAARDKSPSPSNGSELVVAAASNLSDAFAEIGRAFTAQTGIKVTYSFAATGDLTKQIENGAPFDVFAAADAEHVAQLEERNLLTPDTRARYARGSLVLWLPPNNRAATNVMRIEDLKRDDVQTIAIAKPDLAPYGLAAVAALEKLRLWPQLEKKIVYGQNVSQTKQYAATGNADAAFLPRSLIKDGEGRAIDIPEDLHAPINQDMGVIKASRQQEAARSFVRFVTGPDGQAILARYGYQKP